MRKPLIVYDSGVGGLSILKKFLYFDYSYDINYIIDDEFFPLGNKEYMQIQDRIKFITDTFFKMGSNLAVLACNTATVVSIRELQSRFLPYAYPLQDKNILGVSTPLIEYLTENFWKSRDELGFILSTNATFRSGFYQAELLKNGFRNFLAIPCKTLATTIETGNESEILESINSSIEPFVDKLDKVKMVVLACTHYHFAKDFIQSVFFESEIIDPTELTARKLYAYIHNHEEYSISTNGELNIFYTSSKPDYLLREKIEMFLPDRKFSLIRF
jgi:glutamate racemase